MPEAFTANVMIFIEQFWAIWPWSIGVLESWLSMSSSSVLEFSASHCSEHTYSDHSWRCLSQPGKKHRGEGILRMEDARTAEEDDDIDSQDSNTPIDHGHLAQNCSIKIITPAVKASVISFRLGVGKTLKNVINNWIDQDIKNNIIIIYKFQNVPHTLGFEVKHWNDWGFHGRRYDLYWTIPG